MYIFLFPLKYFKAAAIGQFEELQLFKYPSGM